MMRYHARWICPVSSSPVRDATLVEEGGRITYVGPRDAAPTGGDDVELGDAIVVPGLVNTHCHLELTAMRGFLDGLAFREWILRLTFARRDVLTPAMLLDAARLGVMEGLRHGITTFADTGDTGAGFDAMLEAGVRGICYREVFGPDPRQCDEAMAGLVARVTNMRARATALVRVGVSPHAPYTVSDALFRSASAYARAESLPLAVHIAESAIESRLIVDAAGPFADGLRARGIAVERRGESPVALLERLEVMNARTLLIHCVRVDDHDVATISRHNCAVAHCPASNARLGHGVAPVNALLHAGVRVGLGTDSVASNDRQDILDEARLASLFACSATRRQDALSATRALELATIGGASALGIDADVGTLESGKSADFAAFPLLDHRAPVHDPVVALIHSHAGVAANFVAVRGRPLVRDSQLLAHDPALAGRVQHTADRLQAWLAERAATSVTASSR